jgi:uncharacterized protein (TIRG00374 family)
MRQGKWLKTGFTILAWLLVALLLWLALKDVPFAEIPTVFVRLQAWQICILLALNGFILWLMGQRWWLVLHSMGYGLPQRWIVLYRLVSFGVSYFTPGPQFGGEPVQVFLLQRRHQVPVHVAISSVFLDKLIEVLFTFLFMVVGLCVLLFSGAMPGLVQGWLWIPVTLVLAAPFVHLAALWRGKRPLSAVTTRLATWKTGSRFIQQMQRLTSQAEEQLTEFIRTEPEAVVRTMLYSAVIVVIMVAEYGLMLNFLGFPLTLAQTVEVMTAARLALLMPLPGGLGALEASQAFALQAVGYSLTAGISLSLLMRGRDVLIGGLGLLAGIWLQSIKNIQNLLPPLD